MRKLQIHTNPQTGGEVFHNGQESAVGTAALTAEIAELEEMFSTFLLKYGVKTTPDRFPQALDTLRARTHART